MVESGQSEPEWAVQVRTAMQSWAEQVTRAGHILAAQGAMGWLYRGDLDRARRALSKLPPDVLQQISVAASALSALADECAAEAAPATQ